MTLDYTKRNSPGKGHGINGMNKSFYKPPKKLNGVCKCTRTYRCPKHKNGATP